MGHRIKEDICGYWKAAVLLAGYLLTAEILFHGSCPMILITGFPCPGCGMTRAFLLVLQFQFARALEIHPLIYGWILLAVIFCIARYGFGRSGRWIKTGAAVLLTAMLVLYVYRMIRFFPGQEPMVYRTENLMRKILALRP